MNNQPIYKKIFYSELDRVIKKNKNLRRGYLIEDIVYIDNKQTFLIIFNTFKNVFIYEYERDQKRYEQMEKFKDYLIYLYKTIRANIDIEDLLLYINYIHKIMIYIMNPYKDVQGFNKERLEELYKSFSRKIEKEKLIKGEKNV